MRPAQSMNQPNISVRTEKEGQVVKMGNLHLLVGRGGCCSLDIKPSQGSEA